MNIYNAIASNKRKTWLIVGLFILFITTLGYIYGKANDVGLPYAIIAMVLSAVTSVGSYFFSDKIVLATSGAKQITEQEYPEYYRTVENLCLGLGMPMPKVYVIEDASPNAFATGRDPKHAAICATTGLLHVLNKPELEGVMAHELSHIKNYDIRLMAIVTVLVGTVVILGDIFMRSMWSGGSRKGKSGGILILIGIVFALLSPLIATIIQLAVSRKREFLADASGALITRYPEGLASALEKIADNHQPLRTATNATAHVFIANPFKEKEAKAWFSSLFNTHPPMEERIQILRNM